jgi:hypothetical protein
MSFRVLACVGALTIALDTHAITYAPGAFTLSTGQQVTEGTVTLSMSSTGELQVKEANGTIRWRSGTSGTCSGSNCYAKFQGDHNFVLTTPSGALSLSHTPNKSGTQLTFSSTAPYLSVGVPGSAPLWTSGQAYAPGAFSLASGQTVSVNGVFLGLTPLGAVEVRRVSASEPVLWSSGTFSECSTASSCSLTFTSAGALQLNGPTGVVWTSGTATAAGGSLRLSNFAPYLSIVTTDGGKRPAVWGTGTSVGSTTYVPGSLTLFSNQKIAFGGGYSLGLTASGEVQVKQGSSLIWSSGVSSADCAGACRLRFLDGNLAVLRPNNSGVWSSLTGGTNGYLTLSAVAPYVSIASPRFDTLWSSTSGAVTPVPRTVSSPVRGINAKAETVQSFLDSLGVNTHQDQYEAHAPTALGKLQYIGVRNVRDHSPTTATQAWFTTLASSGIRFTLVDYNSDPAVVIERAKLVGISALDAIEGKNEINNFGFSFNGFFCDSGTPNICGGAAADVQSKLNTAVRADSSLNSVLVYDLTAGSTSMHAPAHGLTALTGRGDKGNVHVYPGIAQPQVQIASLMGLEYNGLLATQGVVTESGYKSDVVGTRPEAVGPSAQAVLGINMWLDGYRYGYRRTFLYTLSDANGQTLDLYGLYSGNGTPKPLAHAAHNLTTILQDSGSPISNTGSLAWSTTPTFAGSSILLQKSTGVFYLILWKEPPAADVISGTAPITYPQLNLPRSQVNVYDPVAQLAPTIQVAQPASGPTTVTFPFGANPLIFEISVAP